MAARPFWESDCGPVSVLGSQAVVSMLVLSSNRGYPHIDMAMADGAVLNLHLDLMSPMRSPQMAPKVFFE